MWQEVAPRIKRRRGQGRKGGYDPDRMNLCINLSDNKLVLNIKRGNLQKLSNILLTNPAKGRIYWTFYSNHENVLCVRQKDTKVLCSFWFYDKICE